MLEEEFNRLDVIFAAIERRGLQFLLNEKDMEDYKAWLAKSKEYKQLVREKTKHI